MLGNGANICSCKNNKCIRHGKCNECIEYHKKLQRLPYCKRSQSRLFKNMKIKKAELKDLNVIIDIFKNAIDTMNDNNIRQWDEIYPNDAILKEDLLKGQMYVVIKDCTIVSVVVLNNECDEQYKNGDWKCNNEKFAVVHRLCVNTIYQNQKIGRNTMLMAEELLRKGGIQSVRLDAFSLNPYALNMYERLGYQKVGEANWRKGLFYLLEKRL